MGGYGAIFAREFHGHQLGVAMAVHHITLPIVARGEIIPRAVAAPMVGPPNHGRFYVATRCLTRILARIFGRPAARSRRVGFPLHDDFEDRLLDRSLLHLLLIAPRLAANGLVVRDDVVVAVAPPPTAGLGRIAGRVSLDDDGAATALPENFNVNNPATEGQGEEEAGRRDDPALPAGRRDYPAESMRGSRPDHSHAAAAEAAAVVEAIGDPTALPGEFRSGVVRVAPPEGNALGRAKTIRRAVPDGFRRHPRRRQTGKRGFVGVVNVVVIGDVTTFV